MNYRWMYDLNIRNIPIMPIRQLEYSFRDIQLKPTHSHSDIVLLDYLLEKLLVELLLLTLKLLLSERPPIRLCWYVFCVLHILLREDIPVLV